MIKSSIRNKFILAIFIGCFIPYFLGGLYLKSFLEDRLYENSINNSKQMLHQVSEQIDNVFVNSMKEEVNMLASLPSVKNAGNNLNNYSTYDKGSFTYIESDVEKNIEEYFRALKESHKSTNFIFMGTEFGGYMEYPKFEPAQGYDPRIRPWYKEAMQQDKIIMSEPYITSNTSEMVVSFARQVKKDNETIGVVGISVKLGDLTTEIGQIEIGENGYILVLSPQQKFIVSPNDSNWILKTPEELGLEEFEADKIEKDSSFTSVINHENYVLNTLTTKEGGLHIIAVTSEDEILAKSGKITNILIAIYIITYVIIFIIVYVVSKRITNPILKIASVINLMTDFNFNFDDNQDVYGYTKRKDEIGTVANALVDLQKNYNELMRQVDYIDDEIRNIDVSDGRKYQLKISVNNPFHGVICSMNVLLDKVDLYFQKLRSQMQEINLQKEHINYLAYHDALTGLPNRRKFSEYLLDKINSKQKGAVILFDIDDFKGINDTLGHAFGDQVILMVANRLEEVLDSDMFVSRFGGDEFMVLIERENGFAEVDYYISKICSAFADKMCIEDNNIEIRFSMGITLFPENSADANQLIMEADLAMYDVKNSGKNGYQYFDKSMMDTQIKKSNIEALLSGAIDGDGFKMVYQPQVTLKTGEIFGYEALLRLKEYNISPAEFIGVAEQNGSIIKIGRIVTEKVIQQLYEWKKAGVDIKPVSINFSANQLHDYEYINFVENLLNRYEIESKFLEIEITESIFFENKKITLQVLKQFKRMGMKIAIDDFGTGYSSLNYLTFLPVDIIKLDRSLNLKFLEIKNVKVMNSLISLVHSLGLVVVAEGIETIEQVKRLEGAGCDYIQGYYFSKPLEANEIPMINLTVYDDYR